MCNDEHLLGKSGSSHRTVDRCDRMSSAIFLSDMKRRICLNRDIRGRCKISKCIYQSRFYKKNRIFRKSSCLRDFFQMCHQDIFQYRLNHKEIWSFHRQCSCRCCLSTQGSFHHILCSFDPVHPSSFLMDTQSRKKSCLNNEALRNRCSWWLLSNICNKGIRKKCIVFSANRHMFHQDK